MLVWDIVWFILIQLVVIVYLCWIAISLVDKIRFLTHKLVHNIIKLLLHMWYVVFICSWFSFILAKLNLILNDLHFSINHFLSIILEWSIWKILLAVLVGLIHLISNIHRRLLLILIILYFILQLLNLPLTTTYLLVSQPLSHLPTTFRRYELLHPHIICSTIYFCIYILLFFKLFIFTELIFFQFLQLVIQEFLFSLVFLLIL